MKRINLTESQFNKLAEEIDEISYRTVSDAATKGDDLFWKLSSVFSDFEDELEDSLNKEKYGYVGGEPNPYLEKIKEYSNMIRQILDKKAVQTNRFHKEMQDFDRGKFYDSDEAEENDVYDMDLNYLQNKYPRQ